MVAKILRERPAGFGTGNLYIELGHHGRTVTANRSTASCSRSQVLEAGFMPAARHGLPVASWNCMVVFRHPILALTQSR